MASLEDMETILAMRNSDLVRPFFVYRETITPETHRAWYEKEVLGGRAVQYLIRMDGEAVGVACVTRYNKEKKEAEWGIFLGKQKAYGQGVSQEAFWLLAPHAARVLGLAKLWARVLESNRRSLCYHSGLGFKEERREQIDSLEVVFMSMEKKELLLHG